MTTVHDFSITGIDGAPRALSAYAGQPLLIVNVASECGYTGQYAGLEDLYQRYKDRGLRVLGVPCNQFGGQEPGGEAEIAAFCRKNYGVTFDLAAKVDVNGPAAHPLYKFLTKDGAEPVKWNFYKFLVDKDGVVVKRFAHKAEPLSPDVVAAVEGALNS
jgi:glutathione peroxidase